MNKKCIVNRIAEKLAKRINESHIIGRDKYTNTAVLIPLVCIENRYHLLFELRNSNIRQGGEVCFPGGKFDPSIDESYLDTAIRETVEEIGVSKNQIKVLGKLGTLFAAMGVCIEAYIAFLDVPNISDLKYNLEEVEQVFTIPLDFFIENEPEEHSVYLEVKPYIHYDGVKKVLLPSEELGLPSRYHKPWGGRKNKIYVYRTKDEIIWGITGELIKEFVRLIMV